MKPEDDKDTIFPSKFKKTRERFFVAGLSPLFHKKNILWSNKKYETTFSISFNPNFSPFSVLQTMGREQASTITELRVLSSTKWYQKSRALNALFKLLQQATPICYSSVDITKTLKQRMTSTQDILNNVSQKKSKTGFVACHSPFFNRDYVFEKSKWLQKVQTVKFLFWARQLW